MRIPISELRRRLPDFVKQVREDPTTVIEVTVRDEVVAELRSAETGPEPGEAVRRLLTLRRRLASTRAPRGERDVSTNAKEYLYGRRRPKP